MTTTSLKLPDELKQRAVAAAERIGVSPHAFMIHAIEQAAETSWQLPVARNLGQHSQGLWIAEEVAESSTGETINYALCNFTADSILQKLSRIGRVEGLNLQF